MTFFSSPAQKGTLVAALILALGGGAAYYLLHKPPQKLPAAAPEVPLPTPTPFDPVAEGHVACPEDYEERPVEHVAAPSVMTQFCVSDLLPLDKGPAPFQENSSLDTLKIACGDVFEDFLIYVGEGECQWGTAMYPRSAREILITWKNWQAKTGPTRLRFVGQDLHFASGLKPGMLLKDVAALNKKPIRLKGYGWEGSGLHLSFQDGTLSALDAPDSPFLITYALDWDLFDTATESENAAVIVGNEALQSTVPELEKFRAQVEFIEFRFPAYR